MDWIGLKLNGKVWHGLAEWCHSILDANRQMNNKKKTNKKNQNDIMEIGKKE